MSKEHNDLLDWVKHETFDNDVNHLIFLSSKTITPDIAEGLVFTREVKDGKWANQILIVLLECEPNEVNNAVKVIKVSHV